MLIWLGALDETIGWIGLGAWWWRTLVAIPHLLSARRTRMDMGDVVRDLDPDGPAYPRSHIPFPFADVLPPGVKVLRGVVYCELGKLRLKLDVYRPDRARRRSCARPSSGSTGAAGSSARGASRASRCSPTWPPTAGWASTSTTGSRPRYTWPDHVVDVKRAIAWVREHADEYGVDPDRICIAGGSAGGHLCALAALTADDRSLQPGFEDADTSVAAAAPFYGVYDFLDENEQHIPLVKHRARADGVQVPTRRGHRALARRLPAPPHPRRTPRRCS